VTALPPDDQLRALQQQAEASVSTPTLAHLRRARQASAAAIPSARRPARWLATAVAGVAMLGLGLGLQQHLQPPSATEAGAAPMALALEDDSSPLDDNPDLYLWLGGTELAMEQ